MTTVPDRDDRADEGQRQRRQRRFVSGGAHEHGRSSRLVNKPDTD